MFYFTRKYHKIKQINVKQLVTDYSPKYKKAEKIKECNTELK